MKKTTSLIFIIIILSTNVIFSQKDISNLIIEPFQKNALLREKVFIHFNKSIYFTNENIWFTSYVAVDETNSPSEYTSNLHVNLLNQQGDVLESKNIFIKNGIGTGDFFVAEDYSSGNYFILGDTNYMMNFGRENAFLQEIKIVNPSENKENPPVQSINSYDIQLFPESGYLLENAENTIGIKALINGKGFPFLGKITNSKGEVINNFTGNELGMGKCIFNYNENETYTAVVTINNTTQIIDVPKANKIGVIFGVDNSKEKELILTLKTNKQTLSSLQNSNLALLFYRNTYISQAVTLSLINTKETTQELVFNKNKMLNGVNIVTLFKDNQPIAERKFFVEKQNEQTAILINELKTENDSITYNIKTLNSKLEPISSQLSISVLPKNSKNFYENQTIKSAFLLTPYVKGNIENPSYYFENSSRKKKEFLDLLLLNQGWSAYSLDEKIKEVNPKKIVNFESGFTVKGTLKKIKKGYDIGILSKENKLVDFSEFSDKKEFSFKNVFAYKGDNVKITLIKKGEPIVKPTQISFIEDKPEIKNYKYLTNNYTKPNYVVNSTSSSISETLNVLSYKLYPNIEVLEQIMLKTVVNKKEQTFYNKENELAHKHKVLAPSFYQNKKVTERMETTFQTVFEYFMSLGYIKHTNSDNYFISLRNARVTLFGKNQNPDNTYPPKIYLDGVNLSRYERFELMQELQELSMKDIDEILINKSGAGGGINGTGGIIKIYRKKGNHQYFEETSENLYEELILLTGFDRATNYYKPQYNMYTKEVYNWSEIDWKNNLQTNEKGEVIIKIPTNEFSKEFQFIINGFSENGLLFNTVYKTGSTDF